MLVILFWLVTFILAADLIFTEGLALLPDLFIGGVSTFFGWIVVGAIASFFVWCFAED